MDGLLIHAHTRAQLAGFAEHPSHALLLVGPAGAGKRTLALALTARLLELTPQKLAVHPYFLALAPDEKGTLSIASVRSLQKFLQLKTTGTSPLRRAVLIENAEALTIDAQNAFLKLLEEPPADTLLVLTTANKRALLPTILSRTQTITVHPPDAAETADYFAAKGDQTTLAQARFLSGGLPGLMSALLEEEDHALLGSVKTAKELLQKSTFERLSMVDQLAKQRAETTSLLDALLRICMSALTQAAEQKDAGKIKRWHGIRKEVLAAEEALAASANVKLALTKMLLHM